MSYALIEYKEKSFLPLIQVEEVYDEVHIYVPMFKDSKAANYGKRVNHILKKYQVKNVILSRDLLQKDFFKNSINSNFNIISGERLYKALINKILGDICCIGEYPIQQCKIVILAHEFSIESLHLVKYISKEVKQLIVISDNYRKYTRIAEELLESNGISLGIFDTNHKNISRCQFIINIDFLEEEIKKYNIMKDGIIISVKENIKHLKNSFNGIVVNDIDIYYDEEYKNFRSLAICEAQVFDFRRDYKENQRRFEKSGFKINAYLGEKGIITEEDIKRVFTKISRNNY